MTTALMKQPPTKQELVAGLDSLPQAWALTPVVDKKPRRKDWQIEPAIPRAQLADQLLHARSDYTGYGLRTGAISGGLLCLDVDGATADELLTLLVQQLGKGVDLPLTIEWTSGKPGRRSLLLQLPPAVAERVDALGFNRSVLSEYGDYKTRRDKDGKVSEAVEFRYNKSQAVLPPSQHPDTGRYDWRHAPDTVVVADCPDWMCKLVVQLAQREFDDEQAKTQKQAARAAHKGFSPAAASSPQENPWDIRNFAHYLDGYKENGSGEWTTCKCPAHDGVSDDSLHIHPGRGSFVCHAYRNADTACTPKKIWQAARDVACSRGYVLPEKRTEQPDWVFLNKLQEREANEAAQEAEADKQRRLAYRQGTDREQAALNSLTHQPDLLLNHRWLPPLPLSAGGIITAVSSAMGTAKTANVIVNWVIEHLRLCPDSQVLFLGYRNMLLQQIVAILAAKGLPASHVSDMDESSDLHKRKIVALCLDSLGRIDPDRLKPDTLIIMDECDATLKHGVTGGTLGSRQSFILNGCTTSWSGCCH